MISREKVKFRKVIFAILIMALLVFGSIIVSGAGKKTYWLVTDGIIDPDSVSVEYFSIWTGQGLETRIAEFQWYVDSGGDGGVPLSDNGQSLGGVKAIVTMTGIGNDLQLVIKIYKGGASNPSIGPEEYLWTIINGKDSTSNCITFVFTDKTSGKTSKTLSLYENDEQSVGIPHGSYFDCRMWLL